MVCFVFTVQRWSAWSSNYATNGTFLLLWAHFRKGLYFLFKKRVFCHCCLCLNPLLLCGMLTAQTSMWKMFFFFPHRSCNLYVSNRWPCGIYAALRQSTSSTRSPAASQTSTFMETSWLRAGSPAEDWMGWRAIASSWCTTSEWCELWRRCRFTWTLSSCASFLLIHLDWQ